VRSSDYWYKRVHLAQLRPDLLIVWTHDSCVPVEVLSLKTGVLSPAYGCPPVTSRNRYTANMIIGQLMCGLQSAFDLLETLPEATK
jgi:hypothetical protein